MNSYLIAAAAEGFGYENVFLKMAILAVPILLAVGAPKNSRNTGALTPVLGNYPDTSLPLSTDTTVTPDAAPTNTTRINVSTSTNFNGTLEGNPATGVVRVTDAHPSGTYTVTVKAFDTGGASATETFTLTVTTPETCTPVNFAAAANFAAGFGPFSIAVGDFNGDGNQDLAVANYGSNNVSILLGDGAGSFGPATSFGVGGGPYSVTVGDFNRDGKQDLAVANYGSDSVSILLGDGAGHFSATTNFAADNGPNSIAVGDFNGDGKQDLAVTNTSSNDVSILLGNGDGTFSAPTNVDVVYQPISVAVGDFNGDGNQDLAVANGGATATVSILLGDGSGNFSAAMNFGTDVGSRSVAMGDFNGNGNEDLAVANSGSDNVSILLGDGAGIFSAPTNFTVGISPLSVAVGDFNGDGKQDLAVANSDSSSNNVSILSRDCGMPTPTPTPTPPVPTSVVSRKTHGAAGPFDIDLPLTGTPGIECRTGGATNDHSIIIIFSENVTVNGNPQAAVTSGIGIVGSEGVGNGGMVFVNGNVVTVPLTNVANAQTIGVTLFDVSGLGNVVIQMGVLAGDVNGNATVSASDVALTKSRIGQAINQTNFRADVTAGGAINASDVSLVKSHVGTGLP